MADLLKIREQLDDTNAAISRLAPEVAANPKLESLRLTEASLRKRQQYLEEEFVEAADSLNRDVCSYRLIPDKAEISIAGVTAALSDFQEMFSVFVDANRNGPKQTAHVSPEIAILSTLNFAYTFPGSLGIVLTADKSSDMFAGTIFDDVMAEIAKLSKATEPSQILRHAKKLGPAPIRLFYAWAKDQIRFGLSSEIKWKRGGSTQKEILVQPLQLIRLSEIIDRTSDDEISHLTMAGNLTMADVGGRKFKLTSEQGNEISGSFKDAINAEHQASLPHRYEVDLVVTKRTKFSTDEEKTDYFLERLRLL